MPWFRRTFVCLSLRRPVFDPVSVTAKLYVDKVALGQVYAHLCGSALSVSIPHCCIIIFNLTLPLSEGQAGEAWATSKKAMIFQLSGVKKEKYHVVMIQGQNFDLLIIRISK